MEEFNDFLHDLEIYFKTDTLQLQKWGIFQRLEKFRPYIEFAEKAIPQYIMTDDEIKDIELKLKLAEFVMKMREHHDGAY